MTIARDAMASRYSVRQFTSSVGEETYMLMTPTGLPSYWPNYYVTIALRSQAMSPKTIRNHLTALARVSDWMFAAEGSDFGERVITGNPLLYNEALALGRFLQLTARAQANELAVLNEQKENPARPRVVSLEAVRPNRRETARERLEEIQDEGYASVLRDVALFLQWAYKLRQAPDRASGFGAERQVFAGEGLRQLRSFIPRLKNKGDQDESQEGLSRDTVQVIEDVMNPKSARNPWKAPFVRDRNYLIWRLFLETGGRRAEVHNVFLANIQLSKANVSFHVSKTMRRTVPFGAVTQILIDEYVKQHWSKLPKWARQEGYLITSEAGYQLSERQVNRIFQDIRRSSDQIPDYITPHTMRRTWNEFLSETLDGWEDSPSADMERKIRNRLMGWSETSTSADLYLRRHIRQKADEVSERLLDDAFGIGTGKDNIRG